METENFLPAARLKKRKREKKKKKMVLRAFLPANTWNTLEKRWDTLARILARALILFIYLGYLSIYLSGYLSIY
jgi:hypothetical protein